MELRIITRRMEITDSIRELVRYRAGFALGRFQSHIGMVNVRFSDLNGPRGGLDKHCQIEARLRSAGRVLAEVCDTDIERAVGRALQRLARGIQTHLERSRDFNRGAPVTRRKPAR